MGDVLDELDTEIDGDHLVDRAERSAQFHEPQDDLEERTYWDGDALRWKNSDNPVPKGILYHHFDGERLKEILVANARITERQLKKHAEERRGKEPTAEQKAEMRAAFGPDTEVVNVLTGETHET